MSWHQLGDWWISELGADPAYENVVTPLLLEVLEPLPEKTYLDLGAGEGRVMRSVQAFRALVHGIELSERLAASAGGTVVAELPQVPMRDNAYDGVYCVLALEHIEDHVILFTEAARVTRPGGRLALVMNHPVWTAPASTPITDDDGEILWRPGAYFSAGVSEMPAADRTVTFYHRPMSGLLTAAAKAGWILELMVEQPHHEFHDQSGIPRLLACRWRLEE